MRDRDPLPSVALALGVLLVAGGLLTTIYAPSTLAQATPPATPLKATAGVIQPDPVMLARNAAESPDPFPAPAAISKPHRLVWTRVTSIAAVPNTSPTQYVTTTEPWCFDPADVRWIFPADGMYAPTLYSNVVTYPPWGSNVVVVGEARQLMADLAWAQSRKCVSLEREVR